MGDVVTALGRAVQEEGHQVEVILPKYDCIQYDEVHSQRATAGLHVSCPCAFTASMCACPTSPCVTSQSAASRLCQSVSVPLLANHPVELAVTLLTHRVTNAEAAVLRNCAIVCILSAQSPSEAPIPDCCLHCTSARCSPLHLGFRCKSCLSPATSSGTTPK